MIPFDPNQPKRELRITSRNFVPEGETGEPDAYLSNADRAALGLRLDPNQPAADPNPPLEPKVEVGNPTRFEMPRPRPMQVSPPKK